VGVLPAPAFRLFPRDGALAQSPLILPPEGAIIRNAVDDCLVSLGLAGPRPAFEAVALPLARGLILGSDALWFISRWVVAEDLERGDLVLLPTDARYLSGAVGLTRHQAGPDHPALDLLMQMTREGPQAGASR
jgi:LysR family pca operon transcriptional activator